MFDIIGRCELNKELIRAELPDVVVTELTDKSDNHKLWQHLYKLWGSDQNKDEFSIARQAYDRTFQDMFGYYNKDDEWIKTRFLNMFNDWIDTVESLEYVLKCYFIDDTFAIVGTSTHDVMLFLANQVAVTSYKDYSQLNGAERRNLISGYVTSDGGSSLSNISITRNEAESKLEEAQQGLYNIFDDIEDVKHAKVRELAELQAEIDRQMAILREKQQSMLDELHAKKLEAQKLVEQMNRTIFMLDSEIYAIRCYTGEVLELKQLRSGRPASPDTQLVAFQKMRYLDEELGKLASIYDVDFSDAKHFENILKTVDYSLDTFAPTERSLMLVRVSKNNVGFGAAEEGNLLEDYKKYHGEKVAIVLRDGDNLYIAWTDDDRINFKDDAFLRPGDHEMTDSEKREYEQGRYEDDEAYEKRMRHMQMSQAKDAVGRYFVFSLMQGIIDRGIIKFPTKIKFSDSEYVVFSYAEGWLSSNKYGSFRDMIDRSNEKIQVGDKILTIQSLRPKRENTSSIYTPYHNDRGIGDRNRTYDVYAQDKKVYPINVILHRADYDIVIEEHTTSMNGPVSSTAIVEECRTKSFRRNLYDSETEIYKDPSKLAYNVVSFTKVPTTDTYEYYISLPKTESNWRGTESRANFQVYDDEFINLTFLNTVYLEYVLNNQRTGDIRIGSKDVDFAHVIPYIKVAMQECRERENKMFNWICEIDESVVEDNEWPVKLTQFMLEKNYHNFSAFRAKQFVRWCKE